MFLDDLHDDDPFPPDHDPSIPPAWCAYPEDLHLEESADSDAQEDALEDEVPELSQEEMYQLEAERWEYDDDIRGGTIDWGIWGKRRDW